MPLSPVHIHRLLFSMPPAHIYVTDGAAPTPCFTHVCLKVSNHSDRFLARTERLPTANIPLHHTLSSRIKTNYVLTGKYPSLILEHTGLQYNTATSAPSHTKGALPYLHTVTAVYFRASEWVPPYALEVCAGLLLWIRLYQNINTTANCGLRGTGLA